MTGLLLDTNAISELMKERPIASLQATIDATDASEIFLSVMTIGELRKGAAKLKLRDAPRAAAITSWINWLETSYGARIIAIDSLIATRWGQISSDRSRPIVDTLIAATALVHDLTLVTRNTSDVADLGVRLLNPWTA